MQISPAENKVTKEILNRERHIVCGEGHMTHTLSAAALL